MIDWDQLWLLECIFVRMTGFVLFNPLLGRSNLPGLVKAGFILVLSMATYGTAADMTAAPVVGFVDFSVTLLLELGVGFALGFVMRLFFSVVQTGGGIIDNQMGITMAQIYDAGTQSNMSVTGSLLNILMVLNFFAANGHYTLLRILTASGELVPYGTAALGQNVASYVAELFISCMLLSVKLALPILAAELGTQIPALLGDSPAILVSDELLPSEMLALDRRKLLGLVTWNGSVDSHTAMLLRVLNIPALTQTDIPPCWDGHPAILDGFSHCLYIDPEPEIFRQLGLNIPSFLRHEESQPMACT